MMTIDEFRSAMDKFRREVVAEGNRAKDSLLPQEELDKLYRKFDEAERGMADRVIAEWALSEDVNTRFSAEALIGEFRIRAATGNLKALADRLSADHSPDAPYELSHVNRILAKLA